MAMNCTLSEAGDMLSALLVKYGNSIDDQVEEGLDQAQDILLEELKTASPTKTGVYAGNWTPKAKKYKKLRLVTNTTMVNGKGGTKVPLLNILEYSTKHKRPHVKKALNQAKPNLVKAVLDAIKEA